ncbi:MAG: hypothetical protein Q4E61_02845 [Alphaproteobacteria bacterium]|nr:hypothetical protein [Alphaproteobacteria bacterium]
MDTNYQMLMSLYEKFHPKQQMYSTESEISLIKDTLFIDNMSILELRNLRDMTVMFFEGKNDNLVEKMDKISAITHVIDCKIVELGGEV